MDKKNCSFLFITLAFYYQIAFGQELNTIVYDIKSDIKTNTVYDIHFSSDSLLYISTDRGLWQYNGIQFKEIPTTSGSPMNGSYLREPRPGRIYMQTFNGQIYQIVKDTLQRQIPPKEIQEISTINFIHLDEQYIYYVSDKQVFIYTYDGEQNSIIVSPRIHFSEKVLSNGLFGARAKEAEKLPKIVSAQLKNGTLNIFKEEWILKFEHQFQKQRLINDLQKKQIYTPDQSLFIDWSKCTQKITPRLVRKVANTILVGCPEGLYIPSSNRLLLKGKYITDITEDNEGNIWVSTLNKGLHKLISLENYLYPIQNKEKAVHLIYKRKDQLIYADIESNLYQYDGKKFNCFFETRKNSNPKNLYFDKLHKCYVLSGDYLQTFNTNLEVLAYVNRYGKIIKDQEGFILSKLRVNGKIAHSKLEDYYKSAQHYKSPPRTEFTHKKQHYKCVIYNEKIKLIKFNEKINSAASYKWKNQAIYYLKDTLYYANLDQTTSGFQTPIYNPFERLMAINDYLYVQTRDSLFTYNSRAEQISASLRIHGLEKSIISVSNDNNFLCLTTLDAVYVLNISNLKLLYKFTPQNGIASIDFNKAWIFDSTLYINGSEGVTSISLSTENYTSGSPSLTLGTIYANGEKSYANQFSYQENNLKISFNLRSFTAKGTLYWRLNGKDWRTRKEENSQIRLDGLQYGKYNLEAYWLNDLGAQSTVLNYKFTIHKPYWLQWWFILSALSGSIFLAYLLYKRRIQQLKQKNELENDLVASQMTALKSQMNPHFIFNALNSIQSLIVYQKTNEAFDYVDKFSILLRQILHLSDQDFIPLHKEIEMLHNYLDMEKMRFDGRLDIKIDSVEDTDVLIPSMIIQPFVENAIKHGLLHKVDGERIIKIRFELKNNDTLICEVFDNGIGRKLAQALKSKENRFTKSFSTHATQKRLELLQKVQLKRLGIEYNDLEDADGNPLGTKVKITIPIE